MNIDAGDVDTLELACDGAWGGDLRVWWAGPGDDFSLERSVAVPDTSREGNVFTFRVGTHSGWRGRIERLRLEPAPRADLDLVLRRLTALHSVVKPEGLAGIVERPWQVVLSGDMRPALVSLPGAPPARELQIPPDAAASFSYGMFGTVDAPVTFRVVTEPQGGERQVLFEETLPVPTASSASEWHEATVSLERVAGRRARILLETACEATIDPARGLPVWGDPALLRRPEKPQPPNVLLISVDTLRADHLSSYGYQRSTSPNLDAWAEKGATRFASVVAPTPWTLPSHASMLTGRDALGHGVNQNDPAPPSLTTVAELLRQAGYTTVAFTGGGWLHPRLGLGQGFDSFRYWRPEQPGDRELHDDVDALVRWIDEHDTRPFFAFLHTYEVHSPLRPRQPYFSRFHPDEDFHGVVTVSEAPPTPEDGFRQRKWYVVKDPGGGEVGPLPRGDAALAIDLYDAGIAYADEQLERLLSYLAETGLDRSTLVILTSDHGEAFGEKGLGSHSSLYDFDLMVPLMIAPPGRRRAREVVSEQVRIVDVAPTILDYAGVPRPSEMDGFSLRPAVEGRSTWRPPPEAWSYAASSNFGLSLRLGNRLKYIFNDAVWRPVAGAEELYRLDRDPEELDNRASGSRSIGELRAQAVSRLEQRAQGVELRLANDQATTWHLELTGAWLNPSRIKSWDIPPGAAVADLEDRILRLEVKPGESYSVVLMVPSPPAIRMRGTIASSGGSAALLLDRTLQQDDVATGKDFFLLPGTSELRERVASGAPPSTGLRVTWRGEATGSEARTQAAVDSELRGQLRALGYTD